LLLPPGQTTPFLQWQGRDELGEALLNSTLLSTDKNDDQPSLKRVIKTLQLQRK
jgi:hypothetical protein